MYKLYNIVMFMTACMNINNINDVKNKTHINEMLWMIKVLDTLFSILLLYRLHSSLK